MRRWLGVVALAIFKAAELSIKALPVYGYGTMLFLGFLASMLVLAGAEWSARGHKLSEASHG